jgi:hypothetical protein
LSALSLAAMTKPLPAYMTIRRWNAFTGMNPTDTYEAIVSERLVTIRPGRDRLVDVAHGLEYLRTTRAPPAETLERLIELGVRRRRKRKECALAPA